MVAQGVIEHLELVHVNEHQRTLAPRMGLLGQHMLQPVHQQQPVGQGSQGIVERQLVNGVGRCLALGDITPHGHPVGQLAL